MSNRNPNDSSETKEYIFYISGELTVEDYSEEQAYEQLSEMLTKVFREAENNTIEIE